MDQKHRRKFLAGFAVAASSVLLASTAYACTVFVGRMDVSNASGSAFYVGARSGMNWCAADKGNPPPWNLTAPASTATSVTISTTGAATCLNSRGKNQAAKGTYSVGLHSGLMPAGGGPAEVHNCHGSVGTTSLGTFTVGKNGIGAATSYSYSHGPGWHSICIYGQGMADANAVNINAI